MSAFTITITGPDGYQQVRRFPTVWCADGAIAAMQLLQPGYHADTTEAEAAQREAQRLRMEQQRKK